MTLSKIGFVHQLEVMDGHGNIVDDTGPILNKVPLEGLTFLMLSPFGDTAPINTFYCGLFTKNFIAGDLTTAAKLQIEMGEFVQFEEATRPSWDRSYNGAGSFDNFDSPAVFTPTQDANVYGSFIVSSATKGGVSGLLVSVAKFPSVKKLTAGNEAKLKTSLTYMSKEII